VSFFKIAEKWPQNAPSPCEMYQLIEKTSFRRRCSFLVFPTSLTTKVSRGFVIFVVVVEIAALAFCSLFLFFVRAQPIMYAETQ